MAKRMLMGVATAVDTVTGVILIQPARMMPMPAPWIDQLADTHRGPSPTTNGSGG